MKPGIFLVSTYGLCVSLSIILCGGAIGQWLDSTPRLQALRLISVSRNLTIAVAAVTMYYLVYYKSGSPLHKPLLVLVHILGAMAGLGATGLGEAGLAGSAAAGLGAGVWAHNNAGMRKRVTRIFSG